MTPKQAQEMAQAHREACRKMVKDHPPTMENVSLWSLIQASMRSDSNALRDYITSVTLKDNVNVTLTNDVSDLEAATLAIAPRFE